MSLCNRADWMREVSGNVAGNLGVFYRCNATYCLVRSNHGGPAVLGSTGSNGGPLFVGQCVPASCNASEIASFCAQNELINFTNVQDTTVFCSSSNASIPVDPGAVLALLMFSLFCGFAVLCTIADYLEWLEFGPKKRFGGGGTSTTAVSKGGAPEPADATRRESTWFENDSTSPSQSPHESLPPSKAMRAPVDDDDEPEAIHLREREPLMGQRTHSDTGEPLHQQRATAFRAEPNVRPMMTSSVVLTRWEKLCILLVDAFSLMRSVKRWRFFPRGSFALVFNSMRVLCLMWIGACATVNISAEVPGFSSGFNRHLFLYAFADGTTYAIATFLFVSGFLAMYTLDQEPLFHYEDEVAVRPPPTLLTLLWFTVKHIAKRWIRMSPLYGFVLLVAHPILIHAGHGPYWGAFNANPLISKNCADSGWVNLFYLNNVYPTQASERCFPWTFYFALEFQYQIFTPLLYYLYRRVSHKLYGAILAALTICNLIFICLQEGGGFSDDASFTSDDQTTQPQLMLFPFLGGISLFVLFRELHNREEETAFFTSLHPSSPAATRSAAGTSDDRSFQVQQELLINAISDKEAWLSRLVRRVMVKKYNRMIMIWGSWTTMLLYIIFHWLAKDIYHKNTAFGAFVRITRLYVWTSCMVIMLLPMLFGYGGFFRRVLSHSVWCLTSRLVFAGYLIYPLAIYFYNSQLLSPMEPAPIMFMYSWWGHLSATLVVSLLLHLVVEQPLVSLTK